MYVAAAKSVACNVSVHEQVLPMVCKVPHPDVDAHTP